MGIGDFVDRAKKAVAGNEDKIAGAIDKAAGAVKGRTSEGTDRRIDQATAKAREYLEKQKGDAGAEPPARTAPPVRHPERTDPPAL
ncbi:antitoxin [Cellulomonas pakistanensis]|uniref:Uncharacterized protein n=1 Tax=Cellulomonas pakistanensis TaxID=992287 RepID=A0A919PCH6_9CELL|nr:antitoxin [Cellulomonas pakistanensis]GIG37663.1 hypothetical protein Cpa01nite_30440 [Cellulomonas pakistanensis]